RSLSIKDSAQGFIQHDRSLNFFADFRQCVELFMGDGLFDAGDPGRFELANALNGLSRRPRLIRIHAYDHVLATAPAKGAYPLAVIVTRQSDFDFDLSKAVNAHTQHGETRFNSARGGDHAAVSDFLARLIELGRD